MFCPQCGTQVPDGANFCPACSTPLTPAGTAPVSEPRPVLTPDPTPVEETPPVYAPAQTDPQPIQETTPLYAQAPYYAPQPAPVAVAPKKVKKGNLISNLFDAKLRVLAILAIFIWLGAIAVTYVSYDTATKSQIEELPIVTTASTLAGEELKLDDRVKDELSEALDQARVELRNELPSLSDEDYEKVESLIDTAEALLDDPTLGNLQAALPQLNEVLDVVEENREYLETALPEETREMDSMIETLNKINDYSWIMDLLPYVLKAFLAICLLFTALGGLFKSNGLLFIGMLFTALFTGIFVSIPYLATACGLIFVLMILNGFLNRPYRQYKKSIR